MRLFAGPRVFASVTSNASCSWTAMSNEERPAKRPREDSEPAPITRSLEYWFDDGSIVLQVESTQFRVAKSMLARHSVVFKDMLSLPLPPDEPLVEGCPVVVLHDSSADWAHLLGAMYTTGGLAEKDEAPVFQQLAAILRLSKKYDIPELRRRCVGRLKNEFSTTLAAYDKSRSSTIDIRSPDDEDCSELAFNVLAVKLAREVGIYSILPSAFYTINLCLSAQGLQCKVVEDLSLADQLVVFRGRATMAALYSQSPFKWMDSRSNCVPANLCAQPEACRTAVLDSQTAILRQDVLPHYFPRLGGPHSQRQLSVHEVCACGHGPPERHAEEVFGCVAILFWATAVGGVVEDGF
ncbi:BTB domain-containing protein [Mycena kentingensis (nom. inval.)]|nr:BTB domain-containing protein [Mycena kentingensis (nom. inval.)]